MRIQFLISYLCLGFALGGVLPLGLRAMDSSPDQKIEGVKKNFEESQGQIAQTLEQIRVLINDLKDLSIQHQEADHILSLVQAYMDLRLTIANLVGKEGDLRKAIYAYAEIVNAYSEDGSSNELSTKDGNIFELIEDFYGLLELIEKALGLDEVEKIPLPNEKTEEPSMNSEKSWEERSEEIRKEIKELRDILDGIKQQHAEAIRLAEEKRREREKKKKEDERKREVEKWREIFKSSDVSKIRMALLDFFGNKLDSEDSQREIIKSKAAAKKIENIHLEKTPTKTLTKDFHKIEANTSKKVVDLKKEDILKIEIDPGELTELIENEINIWKDLHYQISILPVYVQNGSEKPILIVFYNSNALRYVFSIGYYNGYNPKNDGKERIVEDYIVKNHLKNNNQWVIRNILMNAPGQLSNSKKESPEIDRYFILGTDEKIQSSDWLLTYLKFRSNTSTPIKSTSNTKTNLFESSGKK